MLAIVEHKDATALPSASSREGYSGMMAAPTGALKRWVGQLTNNNAQGEYYLTDIVAMAVAEGLPVLGIKAGSETEVLGVNDPVQLAQLERAFQAQPGGQPHARRRAPGRPDPVRPARHPHPRPGRRDRRELCLRGPGERWATACASARTASSATRPSPAGARIHEFTHIDGEAAGVSAWAKAR